MDSTSVDSDSGEKVSTTDELESSQKWSDYEEENSDDSATESQGSSPKPRDHSVERRKVGAKRNTQSDTETKNLLDDVGGFEDEYLDLEETDGNADETPIDSRVFEMSEDQLDYYKKCFLLLQRKTQACSLPGSAALTGAVSGADSGVVEFFKKSRLDTETLSRIWSLSDVNEDGFLNLSEFLMAMHLIVLCVKGNMPIPARLPSPVRPCVTPPRRRTHRVLTNGMEWNSATSSTISSDNTSRSSYGVEASTWDHGNGEFGTRVEYARVHGTTEEYADFTDATTTSKQHSLSDDHLHAHAQRDGVTKFSDVPPVLVDSHPTALNATDNSFSLLSRLGTRGPPPQPPPRDYTGKGHGRSASLDLKTFAALSLNPSNMSQTARAHETRLPSEPCTSLLRPEAQPGIPSFAAPWSPQMPGNSIDKATTPSVRPAVQFRSCSMQTESHAADVPSSDIIAAAHDVLAATSLDSGSSKERCDVLRKLNAQLENERVMLSQIRLQLQLRIDEADSMRRNAKLTPSVVPAKPTVL